MQILVGLLGYAGAGKDTAADVLVSKYGFKKVSFASALKEDLKPLLDKMRVDLNDREQKEKVRDLLVEYGRTCRKLDQDWWVKRLDPINAGDRVVISDVRYLNEVQYIAALGGITVKIIRDQHGAANKEEARSFVEIHNRWPYHSPLAIPLVSNCGTPEELGDAVYEVVTKRVKEQAAALGWLVQ